MASVYKMVTDRIIDQLNKGIIPWEKPWTGIRGGAYNRVSKKPYSLLNQMLLEYSGEYATLKQWSKLGGKVKKGSKSEFVVFWKFIQKEKEDDSGKKTVATYPMLRYYRVFHISKVDGVEPLEKPFNDVNPIDVAENIINKYVNREGLAFIETVSNKAYYSPMEDKVVVPDKKQFANANGYYGTVFHELVHSTGHKLRLNRFTSNDDAHFGSESYSKEELVAEIGSASLMNMTGIETDKTIRNNVAYIQSWLKALQNDEKFVVSAGGKAGKAVDYIIGIEQ